MRMVGIGVVALVVNVLLFVVMENMISRDRVRIVDAMDAQTIDFVRTAIDDRTIEACQPLPSLRVGRLNPREQAGGSRTE